MAPPRKVVPFRQGSGSASPPSPQGGPAAQGAIVGRRFEGERVSLGGAGFERCAFVRCELVYDGHPTRLVDNRFEDCRWSFEGVAADTLEFVAALCRDDPRLGAMFARALGLEHERVH